MSIDITPTLANIILAQDAGAAPAPGGILGNPLVFMALMFVMMYFVLIRPQRKRQQEQEALLKALKVGDEVVTIGGAHGIITSLKDKTVMVKIADNTKVEYDRSAIARVESKSNVVEA